MKIDKNKHLINWKKMMCDNFRDFCIFIPNSYGCIDCLYDIGFDEHEN